MPESTLAAGIELSQEPRALTDRTFEKIRKLIYEKAGIDLRQGKQTRSFRVCSARLARAPERLVTCPGGSVAVEWQ